MTTFDFPGHLAEARPDAFASFVADMLRTNLNYPCTLAIHYAARTESHVFETREKLRAFAEAVGA
jgi:hypothetical protein